MERNNVVAALLAIFLGFLGIHKFYMGRIFQGVVYMALSILGSPIGLFVLVGIFSFIEGIIYISHKNENFNRKYCR